jgi:hypothetical protein
MDVFASDLLTGVLEVVQDCAGEVEKVGGNLSTLVRCKSVAALPDDGADEADEPRDGDLRLCGHVISLESDEKELVGRRACERAPLASAS